jgi:hypothetical protein
MNELDAFALRLLHFPAHGRHLALSLDAGEGYIRRAHPEQRPGNVRGDASTADYEGPLPDLEGNSGLDGGHEIDGIKNPHELGAGNRKLDPFGCTGGDEDGVAFVGKQIGDGRTPADLDVRPERDSLLDNRIEIPLDDVRRKPKRRHRSGQHASE